MKKKPLELNFCLNFPLKVFNLNSLPNFFLDRSTAMYISRAHQHSRSSRPARTQVNKRKLGRRLQNISNHTSFNDLRSRGETFLKFFLYFKGPFLQKYMRLEEQFFSLKLTIIGTFAMPKLPPGEFTSIN